MTPAELVDRYHLRCRPVRDLLVDYLTERQPSLDHKSLITLSTALANNFWADLERHHEDINSLHLTPEVAAAWKTRVNTVTRRRQLPDGRMVETTAPRSSAPAIKTLVRAFYLDISQWALDEPARWGPWAARCPVTETDCSDKKTKQRQKTASDQRTRERLPVLPALIRVADRRLKEARTRPEALHAAPLGAQFTALGETFTAPKRTSRAGLTGQAYDASGRRRDPRQKKSAPSGAGPPSRSSATRASVSRNCLNSATTASSATNSPPQASSCPSCKSRLRKQTKNACCWSLQSWLTY